MDLKSLGYHCTQVEWSIVPDSRVPQDKSKLSEREITNLAFDGVELQMELVKENADIPATSRNYAFLIDASEATLLAVNVARLPKPHQEDEYEILGVCKMGRVDVASGKVGEIRELMLYDLETQHLLDRLSGEVLSWHAESFGPGPTEPAGRARMEEERLDCATPRTKTAKCKRPRL
jgi:hypothetical protein